MKKIFPVGLTVLLLLFTVLGCTSPSPTSTAAPKTTSVAPVTTTTTNPVTTTAVPATTTAAPKPTTTAAPAQVFNWKMQSYVAPGNSQWDFLVQFVKSVKEKTNGGVNITLYASGSIVGGTDLSKALTQGVFESAHTALGYDVGWIPEAYIAQGLPFEFNDLAQASDFWYNYQNGAAWKIITDAYASKGIVLLSDPLFVNPVLYMTKFPVTSLDDFKGKKIRSSPTWAAAITGIGGSQVNIAMTETYTALQTKVIDGVLMNLSTLEDFKLKEVVSYIVMPQLLYPGGSFALEFSPAEWNKLPDNFKTAIQSASTETTNNLLVPDSMKAYNAYLDTATKAGIKIVNLPDSQLDALRNSTVAAWNQAGNASPQAGQIMQLLKTYLTSKGLKYPGS